MPATAEQTTTHSFYSRGRNELLIRRPLQFIETATGPRLKTQDRVVYDFSPDGRLDVREGQDRLADGPRDPETGEPSVQDAIAYLEAHPLLNSRFWHEGYEPGRLLPTEDDFLEDVTAAVAALSVERIEALQEQEEASHNRSLLVKACTRAIKQVEKHLAAELAAQEAAEAAAAAQAEADVKATAKADAAAAKAAAKANAEAPPAA